MKRFLHISLVLALSVLAASCQKNLFQPLEQGQEVSLTLRLESAAEHDVVVTKAFVSPDEERYISDIRVFIFNTRGQLIGYKVFGKIGSLVNETPTFFGFTQTLKDIQTRSGQAYIYAIANLSTSQYYIAPDDKHLIDNIDPTNLSASELTRDRFLAIKFQRQEGSLQPLDARFLMTGSVNGGQPVTIGRDGTISNPTDEKAAALRIYRVLSKNTVNINGGDKFKLLSYRLMNVPLSGPALPVDYTPRTSDNSYTLIPNDEIAASYTYEDMALVQANSSSLELYLPENLAGHGTGISSWDDRERNTWSSLDKSFDHAPANATYLVLTGTYAEDRPGNVRREASVSYTIHLGDFGARGDITDFNVCRNYQYTYNVTVAGVDRIVVEAKATSREDATDNPGAEGIVIDGKADRMYYVDAHYEARVMNFTQAEVKAALDLDKPFLVYVKTNFAETPRLVVTPTGVYDAAVYFADVPHEQALIASFSDAAFESKVASVFFKPGDVGGAAGDVDYKWIKFVKNTSDNRITNSRDARTDVCKYPGDSHSSVMDVFHMLRELFDNANNNTYFNLGSGNNRSVTYSMFIDENYYADKTWDRYTNLPDDRIMLFAEGFDVSPDAHSLYSEIKYGVSQKPIWTFYNPTVSGSVKAYGFESINNEPYLKTVNGKALYGYATSAYGSYPATDEQWDGYAASQNAMPNRTSFTADVSTNANNIKGRQDEYQSIRYACLSRNRDLNGNGTLDANERRWYLATIDQYKGMWMANDIFPESSRLVTQEQLDALHATGIGNNSETLAQLHYFTATKKSGMSNLWAEEGAATGTIDNNSQLARHLRCVRTLESGGQGLSAPDKYFTVDKAYPVTSGAALQQEVTVSLDYIDPRALRGAMTSPFAIHFEREEQDRLSAKFVIAATTIPGTFSRQSLVTQTADNDPCYKANPAWRSPNLRELSFMQTIFTKPGGNAQWGCRTRYFGQQTGWYKDVNDNRWGYGFLTGGTVSLSGSDGNAALRCVRDVAN